MTRTLDPYLDHLSACNRWTPGDYVPFRIGHERYGAIRRDRLDRLMVEDDLLTVTPAWVELIAPPERLARSAALADLVRRLVASGDLAKERHELYPVLRRWGQEPVALVDRAAADFLGIRAYGVHLNVVSDDEMWIARRAKNKAIAPGKLDNLVAGGQPYGSRRWKTSSKNAPKKPRCRRLWRGKPNRRGRFSTGWKARRGCATMSPSLSISPCPTISSRLARTANMRPSTGGRLIMWMICCAWMMCSNSISPWLSSIISCARGGFPATRRGTKIFASPWRAVGAGNLTNER
ncbi:DUF4743 domain-containing protein [Elstera litoralis]|uniref:DUF4743 domain-containing protein n=1 Tax=Elstera litoralis TaxID=552518 RepID=UPI000A053F83|nr:DUF4743 domain-containing protein [Elstera litoralis]